MDTISRISYILKYCNAVLAQLNQLFGVLDAPLFKLTMATVVTMAGKKLQILFKMQKNIFRK